ncbi:nitrous oxide reductase family maturation protein NosD [Streptomyces sp. HPF1205]|uniref:right-handed parallel beta-helix repeat-containing protein n=1 Tax=Streptomyces sp. HPF1205 TaxID=2873262 RepID=UPI001CECB692|nr:right-handed parallel beta-helix repeat-containing protein [Streptomyces sp. HPF1205]
MPVRQGKYLAGVMTVAALGAGFATAPAAHAAFGVHVVRAGQSIQAAVDQAREGDTVYVMPGTYRESLRISKALTLRGADAGAVVLRPAVGKAVGAANACAAAGDGICVRGDAGRMVSDVHIESLTVQGFAKNGIDASGTDRMTVRRVTVQDNGQQGISQEKSTRAVLADNQAVGNGQSGIFVANLVDAEGGALDTQGTVISHNTLMDNKIGATVRRARVMTIENNQVAGNCGGVFVVGDENNPKAGDLDIKHNTITANNKYCAATTRLPAMQGIGVLLTGAEDTRVTDNQIMDNVGTSPMSGGIVLYPSNVGVANMRNQVSGNVLSGNAPADVADRDAKGAGNVFTSNTCKVSEPAGRC